MNNGDIVNDKDIRSLIRRDKIFNTIYKQYGAPPNWSREPGFVSLSRIILEQQVSLASANAHFQRLKNYIVEFTPVNILKLNDEEMRDCHISRQKAKYLRALSDSIAKGEIDLVKLSALSEPEVRACLTSVKGIGNWTTDIYLIFCMQAKDIFPLGDIAAVNTVRELTGAQTSDEIGLQVERWKPLRSLAVYFLWHYYLKKRNRSSEQN